MILCHGHHATLLTFGREYEERLEQILATKPASEHEVRARCMWEVMPEQEADLPAAVLTTYRARVEAYRALVEADRAHAVELEAWHARHCPAVKTEWGCPWDGHSLVGVGA